MLNSATNGEDNVIDGIPIKATLHVSVVHSLERPRMVIMGTRLYGRCGHARAWMPLSISLTHHLSANLRGAASPLPNLPSVYGIVHKL